MRMLALKFVVDGTWSVAEDQEVQDDGTGNTNNVFRVPNAPVIAKSDAPMQAASAPPPAAEEEQDAKKVKTVEVIRSQEEVANSGHTGELAFAARCSNGNGSPIPRTAH